MVRKVSAVDMIMPNGKVITYTTLRHYRCPLFSGGHRHDPAAVTDLRADPLPSHRPLAVSTSCNDNGSARAVVLTAATTGGGLLAAG